MADNATTIMNLLNEPADNAPWLQALGSRYLTSWLAEQQISLALTTYQTGKLFLIGRGEDQQLYAANGDILTCEYGRTVFGASTPGTFELNPVGPPGIYTANFIAEFVPVSAACTGKFAGVTGSWTMYAVTEPFVLGSTDPIDYSWEGNGTLTFMKKK